jgi:oligoribonuclease
MIDKNHLVWMDLEMTGLDPEKEGIIEIATIITNGDLDVVAVGPNLVVRQSGKLLKSMDEWNRTQHAKSGLTELVRRSKTSVKEAERQTLEFLKTYCAPKKSPLCGSSVHHDRRFLVKYMPRIHEYLHYRHIDVSTVKALVERWYPRDRKLPKHRDAHRALQDLQDSIEDLRHLRRHYFK